MAVYTKRFASAEFLGTGDHLLFTVPADGKVWVVRDIVVQSANGMAQLVVYVKAPGGAIVMLLSQSPLPAYQSVHADLRQVVQAGEEVRLANPGGDARVLMTGYILG